MRSVLALALLPAFLPTAGLAQATAADVAAALRLDEVLAVMREEGIVYGGDIEDGMFPGAGGAPWAAEVDRIYANERLKTAFDASFAAALEETGADRDAIVAFFTADPGRRAVALEIDARRALLDEAVEDASILRLQEMRDTADPRLELIDAFVTANDLVEANVSSGLNSSLAFMEGLVAAGAFPEGMSQAEMLEQVWSQEPDIRADTTEWIYSFLALAYAPLSDAELGAYTAFSETEAGRDLNRALFAAFTDLFADVSRDLGSGAAAYIAGQDI
jgi:hypothetical protein